MNSPDESTGDVLLACPTCGGSLTPPRSSRGVCLSCAGARVLNFATGSPASAPADRPAAGWPGGTGRGDDLPRVIGNCEIIEELGHGGMGRVFAARQDSLGRIVALKAIRAGDAATAELERRFLREAQTIARLRHPHVVAVHEFGRSHGFVYFTMDYIEGGDLVRRVRERSLNPRGAAVLMEKVARALAYTHAEGVLHRDLKPSNILLDGEEPRVADFGLAAQLEPGGDLTAVSGVIGTPHYLAPEALHGGSAALGVASDIYALGVILFELATGRTPFAGASPAKLAIWVTETEAPSPRMLAPAFPAELDTICLKCLERDPARRYASMDALAEDLRRFLAGEPILAQPVSPAGHFLRWCRRRPALAAVWMLVTALAIGSTAATFWIARERNRAERALAGAQAAEAVGQERLREARLAQARAVRRTTVPGRRGEALSALAEAARIRPGGDLRDEALAALLVPDIQPAEKWDLAPGVPGEINFDPAGTLATFEPLDSRGQHRERAALRRWNQAEPAAYLEIPGVAPLGRLRFSRDGRLVMARYRDATLRVWHVGDVAPYLTLTGRPTPDPEVATELFNDDYDFSPDGTRFALGLPTGGVSVHRSSDGAEIARWTNAAKPNSARFSPDGSYLAVAVFGGTPTAFLLEAGTARELQALVPGDGIGSIAWSPDSRSLAVALRQNLVVTYDARDGRLLTKFSSVARNPGDLVFLGGETLLAVRGIGTTTMHLLNAVRGEEELVLDNIGASFVTTAPGTNHFVVADNAGLVTRWTVIPPTGFRTVPPARPSGYERIGDSGALDFSTDGRWEITSALGFSIVRAAGTGRIAGEIDDQVDDVADLATAVFTADAKALIRCSVQRGLRRVELNWTGADACAGGRVEPLDDEKGFVIAAYTSDRRRFALIDYESGAVKVIDVARDGARVRSRWQAPGVYSAVFDPAGRQLLVNCTGLGPDAGAQRLRVHDAATGAVAVDLGPDVSCDSAWSDDGRFALTSHGQKESILWNATTWKPIATLRGAVGGNMTTFTISPDGSYAVIARDQAVYLVSTTNGAQLAQLTVPSAPGLASTIKFVPGGSEFAVLWRDGRVDYINPGALRTELGRLGLAW